MDDFEDLPWGCPGCGYVGERHAKNCSQRQEKLVSCAQEKDGTYTIITEDDEGKQFIYTRCLLMKKEDR